MAVKHGLDSPCHSRSLLDSTQTSYLREGLLHEGLIPSTLVLVSSCIIRGLRVWNAGLQRAKRVLALIYFPDQSLLFAWTLAWLTWRELELPRGRPICVKCRTDLRSGPGVTPGCPGGTVGHRLTLSASGGAGAAAPALRGALAGWAMRSPAEEAESAGRRSFTMASSPSAAATSSGVAPWSSRKPGFAPACRAWSWNTHCLAANVAQYESRGWLVSMG